MYKAGDRVKIKFTSHLNPAPNTVRIERGHQGTISGETTKGAFELGLPFVDWDGIPGPHFADIDDLERV